MKELILYHTISLILGVILDLIIGDPHSFPHPVRAIGSLISFLEKRSLDTETARDEKKERINGACLWIVTVCVTAVVTLLILTAAYAIHPAAGMIIETILSCYILAAGSLYRESMIVCDRLKKHDTDGARYAVSMIVGRDTATLDEEEIAKAAVETVAENTSDGVIAPLIYTAIGGPVLGMIYKAVNTMDSMIGYRNDRYMHFGSFAAKADDIFNYFPSRISAFFMAAAAYLLGMFSKDYNGKAAFIIWRRDRLNHSSPNSAQTESACAGALGLKLGGPHTYRGVMVNKPFIGDEKRKTESDDIKRTGFLMFATEGLVVLLILLILIPEIMI